jgi:alcohol dehydrogenase class IV
MSAIHNYDFPTNIRFGAGVSQELPAYLAKHGLSRPLVVTDPIIREQPFFAAMVQAMKAAGIDVQIFHEINRNPLYSDVARGRARFVETERDSLVGIGGGAALDVTKAIALSIHHHKPFFEYNEQGKSDPLVTEPIPHWVAVPTAAGTGSEVGRSTTIADDETRRKHIVFSPRLIARQVFADPELTMRLSPRVTAATGMDALAHCIEAFLAKGFHPMCDGIALEGIATISAHIEKAVHDPDLEARSQMMIGAIMGAVAFQKGLGIVHALAHPLSTLLDVHHGTAVATMMPYGLVFNGPGMAAQFKRIGQAMKLKIDSVHDLTEHLFELNRSLGMPTDLAELGFNDTHLDALADLAMEDFFNKTNPKPVKRDDYHRIYESALLGH